MDKEDVINALIEYKRELEKNINLKKLFLFGSYSENRQKKDSDIDVAILVDRINGDYLNFLSLIWKIGGDLNSRIEPVIFVENQPDPSGFFDTIQKTGIEII
jgi:predicted nucleotidyltransferase